MRTGYTGHIPCSENTLVSGRTLYHWACIEPGSVNNMRREELLDLWEHLAKIPLHERGVTHRAIVDLVEQRLQRVS